MNPARPISAAPIFWAPNVGAAALELVVSAAFAGAFDALVAVDVALNEAAEVVEEAASSVELAKPEVVLGTPEVTVSAVQMLAYCLSIIASYLCQKKLTSPTGNGCNSIRHGDLCGSNHDLVSQQLYTGGDDDVLLN